MSLRMFLKSLMMNANWNKLKNFPNKSAEYSAEYSKERFIESS